MRLKGYIFSRSFFGERVPQHIQNIVLRDYCKKNNLNLILSSTEYKTKNSTYILEEILGNLQNYDGIIFYSLFQLPENKNLRFKIYHKILHKKKQLNFAVENITFKKKTDLISIEKIFLLKSSSFKNKKLGKKRNFVTFNHERIKRNYIERMNNDKAYCMKVSKKYGQEYWDGDRKYGYGGYKYIPGYFKKLAKKLINTYALKNGSSILDLGCGKGFLLYEMKKILKDLKVYGLDISKYAIKNSRKELRKNLRHGDLNKKLPFKDKKFDLVISINTLHNLKIEKILKCLKEIDKIGYSKYVCVESYRNELEQFNLQCWALTAETIIDVDTWKYLFKNSGYSGDYEFIYFK